MWRGARAPRQPVALWTARAGREARGTRSEGGGPARGRGQGIAALTQACRGWRRASADHAVGKAHHWSDGILPVFPVTSEKQCRASGSAEASASVEEGV